MIRSTRSGATISNVEPSIAAVLVMAVVLSIGWRDFARPGYTPDEEFTEFAVRGIAASGLPLLPSGLLYDRGLAYSYAAWLTRSVGGEGLAPARALSFSCALIALLALWHAVRRIGGHGAAWMAVLLVAASIPFWVVATTARFYAPFLASYLGALAALASIAYSERSRTVPLATTLTLVALAAACRWTHELAFTLAAVPLLGAVLAPTGERARWIYSTCAIVAGLIVAQGGIFALHFLAPQSGSTMIRRFFLWQVLNLFERPPLAVPLGAMLTIGIAALMLRPALLSVRPVPLTVRAWLALVAAASAWTAASGFQGAFDYPLDLFRHLALTMPALTIATLGLLVARAFGLGGTWTPGERAVHVLWIGWVVFFGVIDSGITINYLLAPVTLMLTAVAVDLAALVRRHRQQRLTPAVLSATLIIVTIVATSWGSSPKTRLASMRPTIAVPDPMELRRQAADAELVACTDELACLLIAGRVDRWLALDDFLRERFVVSKAAADVGVYAGTPVAYRFADLFAPTMTAAAPARVLVIDVFKELPVGNSSTFVPRAMDAEGISALPHLETPQLRVLELVSGETALRNYR